jgi:hypothetical protein
LDTRGGDVVVSPVLLQPHSVNEAPALN